MKSVIDINIREEDCKSLLVSFGGICSAPGMPVPEFKSLLTGVELNKIFLVDQHRGWYYFGINDEINSHDAIKVYLDKSIKKYGTDYTMFYGNSMGGFAAILFGSMLNVDRVVAFSPQTFLNKDLRLKHGDTRWIKYLEKLFDVFTDEELQLVNLLNYSNKTTVYDVYFCKHDRLDKIHAEKLKKFKLFRLHGYNKCDHNLVKLLRDRSELKNILIGDLL